MARAISVSFSLSEFRIQSALSVREIWQSTRITAIVLPHIIGSFEAIHSKFISNCMIHLRICSTVFARSRLVPQRKPLLSHPGVIDKVPVRTQAGIATKRQSVALITRTGSRRQTPRQPTFNSESLVGVVAVWPNT